MLLKVRMDGAADFVPDARDGAKRVRARTKMRDGAQVLERVTLLGKRVVGSASHHLDGVYMQFCVLLGGRRCDDVPVQDHAGAG